MFWALRAINQSESYLPLIKRRDFKAHRLNASPESKQYLLMHEHIDSLILIPAMTIHYDMYDIFIFM